MDHVICHTGYVPRRLVVAEGESDGVLMVSAPRFLIAMASFIHRFYFWPSDAIVVAFSQFFQVSQRHRLRKGTPQQ